VNLLIPESSEDRRDVLDRNVSGASETQGALDAQSAVESQTPMVLRANGQYVHHLRLKRVEEIDSHVHQFVEQFMHKRQPLDEIQQQVLHSALRPGAFEHAECETELKGNIALNGDARAEFLLAAGAFWKMESCKGGRLQRWPTGHAHVLVNGSVPASSVHVAKDSRRGLFQSSSGGAEAEHVVAQGSIQVGGPEMCL